MDAMFEEDDHKYVMRVARKIDSSGLETKRRNAIAEKQREIAEVSRKKICAREQASKDRLAALYEVKISTPSEVTRLLVCDLDNQLDRLREVEGDMLIVKAKTKRGRKEEKQRMLLAALERRIHRMSSPTAPQNGEGRNATRLENDIDKMPERGNPDSFEVTESAEYIDGLDL
jgi:hypothetical protein